MKDITIEQTDLDKQVLIEIFCLESGLQLIDRANHFLFSFTQVQMRKHM